MAAPVTGTVIIVGVIVITHSGAVVLTTMISLPTLCVVLVVAAAQRQCQHQQCHCSAQTVMQAALAMWMVTSAKLTQRIQHGAKATSEMMISPLPPCAALVVEAVVPQARLNLRISPYRISLRRHALIQTQAVQVTKTVIFAFNTLPISNGAWVILAMMISLLLPCAVLVEAVQPCRRGFGEGMFETVADSVTWHLMANLAAVCL